VVQGGSTDFNPTLKAEMVERARADDPLAASAEGWFWSLPACI